jgi:hypothetical protein
MPTWTTRRSSNQFGLLDERKATSSACAGMVTGDVAVQARHPMSRLAPGCQCSEPQLPTRAVAGRLRTSLRNWPSPPDPDSSQAGNEGANRRHKGHALLEASLGSIYCLGWCCSRGDACRAVTYEAVGILPVVGRVGAPDILAVPTLIYPGIGYSGINAHKRVAGRSSWYVGGRALTPRVSPGHGHNQENYDEQGGRYARACDALKEFPNQLHTGTLWPSLGETPASLLISQAVGAVAQESTSRQLPAYLLRKEFPLFDLLGSQRVLK